jgi:hypothetical protein
VDRIPDLDTGGNLSIGYIVEHKSGRKAFLKAVDFSKALGATDPARMLESVLVAFNYERDLLAIAKNLSRVATPLGLYASISGPIDRSSPTRPATGSFPRGEEVIAVPGICPQGCPASSTEKPAWT